MSTCTATLPWFQKTPQPSLKLKKASTTLNSPALFSQAKVMVNWLNRSLWHQDRVRILWHSVQRSNWLKSICNFWVWRMSVCQMSIRKGIWFTRDRRLMKLHLSMLQNWWGLSLWGIPSKRRPLRSGEQKRQWICWRFFPSTLIEKECQWS